MKIKIDTFQKALEQSFEVKPEAHFVWNDIAEKFVNKQPITEAEHELLEEAFMELQNGNNLDIVTGMISFRDKGFLTTPEMYLIANYFFTAAQIGPEGRGLKDVFFFQSMDNKSFKSHTNTISIPVHTRILIQNVYSNILELKRLS